MSQDEETVTSGFVADEAEASDLQHVDEGTNGQTVDESGETSGETPSADLKGSFTSVCLLFSSVSTFHTESFNQLIC